MGKKLVLALCAVMVIAGAAVAAEKPVQLALFNPYQMVPETDSIKGLRLSLFYTVNTDMTGFSLAFLGLNRSTGNVQGVEWGLGNWAQGDMYGWQNGWFNYTQGRFVGLQSGLLNVTEGRSTGVDLGCVNYNTGSFKGVQFGLFNYSAQMHGLQLGLINYTKDLNGVQIGLGNYNGNKDPLEIMIIVNWSF